jgi:Na+/H+-dicarboxylate symporter
VIVRWIVAVAPLGVFALVLPLAARGGAGVAGAVGFYVLVYSLSSILVSLLLYPVVMVVAKGADCHIRARGAARAVGGFCVVLLDRGAPGAGGRR